MERTGGAFRLIRLLFTAIKKREGRNRAERWHRSFTLLGIKTFVSTPLSSVYIYIYISSYKSPAKSSAPRLCKSTMSLTGRTIRITLFFLHAMPSESRQKQTRAKKKCFDFVIYSLKKTKRKHSLLFPHTARSSTVCVLCISNTRKS